MNAPARIAAVFAGRQPDRVPICEQAFASSVASQMFGRPMHTGSTELHYQEACAWDAGEQAHAAFVEQVYADTLELHRRLELDILFLPWRYATRPTRRLDEHRFLYGDPDGADWAVYLFNPEARTYGLERAANPDPSFEQVCARIRAELEQPLPACVDVDPLLLRAQREESGSFVVAGGAGMGIPMQRGWLEATLLDPGLLAAFVERMTDGVLLHIEAQRAAGLRLINGGGDFAHNGGPIYSPTFFHEVMAPRWKRIFDRCRQLDAHYIFRSDGNLWTVANDIFAWGRPAAYYECDYDAGMRFGDLRRRYPELVLMGNVSCDLLRSGTPAEVAARTRECVAAAAPRVIAASANSILHGTPPENVLALYEAAKAYRL